MKVIAFIGKVLGSLLGLLIIGVTVVTIANVVAESRPASSTVEVPSESNTGGATAICKDGMYSYSAVRAGTCSGHGGVAEWL